MRRAPTIETVGTDFESIAQITIERPWWAKLAAKILAREINVVYWLSQRYDIKME